MCLPGKSQSVCLENRSVCLPGKQQCVFAWKAAVCVCLESRSVFSWKAAVCVCQLFMNKNKISEWLAGNFIKPLFMS